MVPTFLTRQEGSVPFIAGTGGSDFHLRKLSGSATASSQNRTIPDCAYGAAG